MIGCITYKWRITDTKLPSDINNVQITGIHDQSTYTWMNGVGTRWVMYVARKMEESPRGLFRSKKLVCGNKSDGIDGIR